MTLVDDIVASANALRDVLAANEHTITTQDAELRDLRAYADAQDAALADARAEIAELQARIEELETPPAPARIRWEVITPKLNVRATPSIGGQYVTYLLAGAVVEELERQDVWVRHEQGWSAHTWNKAVLMRQVAGTTDHEGVPGFNYPLVGAGTTDPGTWQIDDDALETIEIARLDAVKVVVPGFGQDQMDALTDINPDMFVMGRLMVDGDARATPEQFVDAVLYPTDPNQPNLQDAYNAGVRFFQAHCEPDQPGEGFGRYWFNGAQFGQWWQGVVDILQPMFPLAKFGFPAISPNCPNYWQFLEAAQSAIEAAAWVGVHVYGSPAQGGLQAASQAVIDFARHNENGLDLRGKSIYVLEFSNRDEPDDEERGRQYVDFFQTTYPQGIEGAFVYCLSATDSIWDKENLSKHKRIAEIIGEREDIE